MYILMNKDKEVAKFNVTTGLLENNYQIISKDESMLPYGFKTIEEWISSRKGSKHNKHLKQIMRDCGCEDDLGYIRITHAASLNDTYWIKNETENIQWKDVSFYRNKFDEQISRLAFEGVGLYGIQLSSTSPELCTDGSFRKCWKREQNDIFMYKRGSSGAVNAGLEPYCEMLASEIAAHICNNAVLYQKVILHKEVASKCQLFTDESRGYVPYAKLSDDKTADTMLRFYSSIGSEDEFRQMLVLDSLIFNVDRHAGNHGVYVNNDTKQILCMAPIFDLNMSLLPYVLESEFSEIGNKMQQYGPRIGDDFTRIGQLAITPSIRSKIINLKDFEFSFKGDDKFSQERVRFLEMMINRQIDALLSKEVLYTKDVFVPESVKTLEDTFIEETTKHNDFNPVINDLISRLSETLSTNSVTEFYDENNNIFIYISVNTNTDIYISSSDFGITVLRNDNYVDVSTLNENEFKIYQTICETVDDFIFEHLDIGIKDE